MRSFYEKRSTTRFKRRLKKNLNRKFRQLLNKTCQPENEGKITVSTKAKYKNSPWDFYGSR